MLSQCFPTFLTRGPSQKRSFLGPSVMFQMAVVHSFTKDTFPFKMLLYWFHLKNCSKP